MFTGLKRIYIYNIFVKLKDAIYFKNIILNGIRQQAQPILEMLYFKVFKCC